PRAVSRRLRRRPHPALPTLTSADQLLLWPRTVCPLRAIRTARVRMDSGPASLVHPSASNRRLDAHPPAASRFRLGPDTADAKPPIIRRFASRSPSSQPPGLFWAARPPAHWP